LKIAIMGVGSIGSTFAFLLASNAHDVTVVARGKRHEQLKAEQAIVTASGQRAAVTVSDTIDPAIDFDLVLVTVLASQFDAVLPSLKASAAKTVIFMFNTFEALNSLRDAVGKERFAFGSPAILATLTDGKLKFEIYTRGQTTIVTEPAWAKVFTDVGILTLVQNDIESWLRTHAVLISTLTAVASVAYTRQAGISWTEAKTYALAMREGFGLVQWLNNAITPSAMVIISRLPISILTTIMWAVSRLKSVHELGKQPSESRTLIDMMVATAPNRTLVLQSIRP
jgi:2-dehydropantoate 2-reductase